MTQRVLTILYLIFYIAMSGLGAFDRSPTADPLWLRAFDGVSSSIVVICILLYLTRTRPNSLRMLFKVIPIAIVLADIFSNAYTLLSPVHSSDPVWFSIFVIICVALISFPSWYICFRFGYLDELKSTEPQVFKKLAIYMWCAICIAIFTPLLFGNPSQQELAVDVARILGPIAMLVVLFQRLKARLKNKDTETQIPTI